MKVYAVVFATYDPAEVDSLWERREDAQARADERNRAVDWSPWEVIEWDVHPAADAAAPAGE